MMSQREFQSDTGPAVYSLSDPLADAAQDGSLRHAPLQSDRGLPDRSARAGVTVSGLVGGLRVAVSSSAPLRREIAEYVNEAVIAQIAEEGRKGRGPLVGTRNRDGRPAIWEITRIPESGSMVRSRRGAIACFQQHRRCRLS
jgi:hypothetical protein